MQQLLHVVHQWSLSHCLAVNSSKNYAIYFLPSVRAMTMVKVTLYLGNSVLTTADTITILGVLFSHDVSWSSHVCTVKSQQQAWCLVQRFGTSLNIDCRQKICQAIIQPLISYCISVWAISQVTLMDRFILRAQKIITKRKTDNLHVANYVITVIIPFGSLLFYNNVRLMFNIVTLIYFITPLKQGIYVIACVRQMGGKYVPLNTIENLINYVFNLQG